MQIQHQEVREISILNVCAQTILIDTLQINAQVYYFLSLYIHVYVYICIYIYVYIYMYIYICICTHTCIYFSLHIHIYLSCPVYFGGGT